MKLRVKYKKVKESHYDSSVKVDAYIVQKRILFFFWITLMQFVIRNTSHSHGFLIENDSTRHSKEQAIRYMNGYEASLKSAKLEKKKIEEKFYTWKNSQITYLDPKKTNGSKSGALSLVDEEYTTKQRKQSNG